MFILDSRGSWENRHKGEFTTYEVGQRTPSTKAFRVFCADRQVIQYLSFLSCMLFFSKLPSSRRLKLVVFIVNNSSRLRANCLRIKAFIYKDAIQGRSWAFVVGGSRQSRRRRRREFDSRRYPRYSHKFSHRICTNLRGPPDRPWLSGPSPRLATSLTPYVA
jgi:hypothetical protein